MTLAQTLFSFRGRINRAKWWLMCLLLVAISFVVYAIVDILGDSGALLVILNLIFSFWAHLAINIKRWHDRNKSGWWVLIELIPLIGAVWALVELGFLKGTYGKNRFGPDPLEHA